MTYTWIPYHLIEAPQKVFKNNEDNSIKKEEGYGFLLMNKIFRARLLAELLCLKVYVRWWIYQDLKKSKTYQLALETNAVSFKSWKEWFLISVKFLWSYVKSLINRKAHNTKDSLVVKIKRQFYIWVGVWSRFMSRLKTLIAVECYFFKYKIVCPLLRKIFSS